MTAAEKSVHAVIVRPRIYIGDAISLGPGKIDLLRAIGEKNSISAAARSLEIPYKKAWLLVSSLNDGFGRPVVMAAKGGKGGGGAVLTQLGTDILERYEALEVCINREAAAELDALRALAE
jgi:molybdate transport system regulatory protein